MWLSQRMHACAVPASQPRNMASRCAMLQDAGNTTFISCDVGGGGGDSAAGQRVARPFTRQLTEPLSKANGAKTAQNAGRAGVMHA